MVLGGLQLVLPGREATFELKATGDHPGRQVTLKAAPVPANPFERFIVLIDQIAGILVVAAAAWLVWMRPGAMSWGFFLYVIWFNPGQVYAFYALLQPRPLLLLAQNLASAIAEAVGYVGLILFVLRAPDNEPDPKRRWLKRMLPLIGAVLALFMLFTYGNLKHRNWNALCHPCRICRGRLRRRSSARTPAAETAGGLPARALGGLA